MRIRCKNTEQTISAALSLITNQKFGAAIELLTKTHYSTSSKLALASDLQKFDDFCRRCGFSTLPPSENTVLRFLADYSLKAKYATIRRTLMSIRTLLALLDMPDTTRSSTINNTLRKIESLARHNDKVEVDFDETKLLLPHHEFIECSPIKQRDLMIVALSYEAGLKRSELKHLNTAQVIQYDDNTLSLSIDSVSIPLSSELGALLLTYLGTLQDTTVLFPSFNNKKQITSNRMNDSTIYRASKRILTDVLGLPNETHHFARKSFARDMYRSGMSIQDVSDAGRWKSLAMPSEYNNLHSISSEAFKKHKKNQA